MVLGIRSAEKGWHLPGWAKFDQGSPLANPVTPGPGLRRPSTSSGQATSGLRGLPLCLPPEVFRVRAEPNHAVGQSAGLRKSDFHAVEPFSHAVEPFNHAVELFNHAVKLFNHAVEPFSHAAKPFNHAAEPFNHAVEPFNHAKPALNRVVKSFSDAVRSVHHNKYLGHFYAGSQAPASLPLS